MKHKKALDRAARLLFWVYLAVLMRLTVLRDGFWRGPLFSGRITLTPFTATYGPLIAHGRWGYILYLFVGNIVCFMPFGAYLVWRRPGLRFVRLLLAGLCLSLFIETMQFVLSIGFSELDDIILNTVGTCLGGWGMTLLRRAAPGLGQHKKN